MKTKEDKPPYVAPELTVVSFRAEHGYAGSCQGGVGLGLTPPDWYTNNNNDGIEEDKDGGWGTWLEN